MAGHREKRHIPVLRKYKKEQQAMLCIGRADRQTFVLQCEMEKLNVNTHIIWTLRGQALQPVLSEVLKS